ncbi:GDSL esterase/lipase At4g16230-like [Phoenix dactylifera]|uniref:GDSL esterase/lipase At4g16230-like n=1 Tax=Phoenix dactylifera TaxID=42345 RepID=A0A8B9A6G2_PHODC|nr:GDSL esterase/lipase At4g16230-like [Phoenix dactylifera]
MEGKIAQLLTFISAIVLVLGAVDASVPAVFIFGDSTADVGNNNFLPASQAKADFLPNGIDFVRSRATGRFSNGLNSADFLAPSKHHSFLWHQGQVISMAKQVQYFETVRSNLIAHMGMTATEKLLENSVFFVSTGSNDILDYFAANGPVSRAQMIAFLSNVSVTYKGHLRQLYNLGARKIGVISIPPIGCCPSQRSLNGTSGCLEELNESARAFYMATEAIMKDLSCELKGLKYSLGNAYEMVTNFFRNAPQLGFTELESACCGAGKFNGESPCLPSSSLCSNRNKYLFWDLFHPTQAASKLAALTLFQGSEEFVTPINFGQLAS